MTRRISAPGALRRLSHFLPALLLAACTLTPHCDRSRADCLRQVYKPAAALLAGSAGGCGRGFQRTGAAAQAA